MMVLITGMCGRCAQIQTPLSDYSPLSFNCALIHNRSWKALLLLSMKGATVWGLYRREHPIRFLLSWKSQIPPCECWRGADPPAFSLKPERTNTPPKTKTSMDGCVRQECWWSWNRRSSYYDVWNTVYQPHLCQYYKGCITHQSCAESPLWSHGILSITCVLWCYHPGPIRHNQGRLVWRGALLVIRVREGVSILLWGAGFVSQCFISKENPQRGLRLCTYSRSTPPTALSLLFSSDLAGCQLEMRLGFGYCIMSYN